MPIKPEVLSQILTEIAAEILKDEVVTSASLNIVKIYAGQSKNVSGYNVSIVYGGFRKTFARVMGRANDISDIIDDYLSDVMVNIEDQRSKRKGQGENR